MYHCVLHVCFLLVVTDLYCYDEKGSGRVIIKARRYETLTRPDERARNIQGNDVYTSDSYKTVIHLIYFERRKIHIDPWSTTTTTVVVYVIVISVLIMHTDFSFAGRPIKTRVHP